MTKHEQYYQEMLAKNKPIFADFKKIHHQYVLEPQKYKSDFDVLGSDIVEIIKDTENRLCAHSEKGRYGVYSDKLAEKFWDLVRQDFPKIDDVGIEISYEPVGALRVKPLPQTKPKSTFSSQSADDLAKQAIDDVLDSLKVTRL